jgi:predicted XRE-type DNA-binding protein
MKAKARESKPGHISRGNVIDDLSFSPEEAAAIKLKTSLHAEILRLVEKRKLKALQLEKILDQPQPRISELLRGKISKMSVEKLAGYLYRLGVEIKISARKAAYSDYRYRWFISVAPRSRS